MSWFRWYFLVVCLFSIFLFLVLSLIIIIIFLMILKARLHQHAICRSKTTLLSLFLEVFNFWAVSRFTWNYIQFLAREGQREAKILPMDRFLAGPITCCLITFLSHEISRLGWFVIFVLPRGLVAQKVHLWFLIPHVTVIPENISVPGTGDLVSTTYFSSKSKKPPS